MKALVRIDAIVAAVVGVSMAVILVTLGIASARSTNFVRMASTSGYLNEAAVAVPLGSEPIIQTFESDTSFPLGRIDLSLIAADHPPPELIVHVTSTSDPAGREVHLRPHQGEVRTQVHLAPAVVIEAGDTARISIFAPNAADGDALLAVACDCFRYGELETPQVDVSEGQQADASDQHSVDLVTGYYAVVKYRVRGAMIADRIDATLPRSLPPAAVAAAAIVALLSSLGFTFAFALQVVGAATPSQRLVIVGFWSTAAASTMLLLLR
jgi:hypothetical protein